MRVQLRAESRVSEDALLPGFFGSHITLFFYFFYLKNKKSNYIRRIKRKYSFDFYNELCLVKAVRPVKG